jgi:hypothetical protein
LAPKVGLGIPRRDILNFGPEQGFPDLQRVGEGNPGWGGGVWCVLRPACLHQLVLTERISELREGGDR